MGRKKWYESAEAMHEDLDEHLIRYNTKRPHQGRHMKGRTPEKVFKEGLTKIKKRLKQPLNNYAHLGPLSGKYFYCTIQASSPEKNNFQQSKGHILSAKPIIFVTSVGGYPEGTI